MAKTQKTIYKNIGLSQIIRYRLPIAGIVSILHRASGALLFFSLPFILILFSKSLENNARTSLFFTQLTSNIFVKGSIFFLIWAFLHHLLAGIRFLIIDIYHCQANKKASHCSARTVSILSALVAALLFIKLFWGF